MTPADVAIAPVQAWHWMALGLAITAAALAARWRWLTPPALGAWATGLTLLFVPLRLEAQAIVWAITTAAAWLSVRVASRPPR